MYLHYLSNALTDCKLIMKRETKKKKGIKRMVVNFLYQLSNHIN
jgi:hypothetical protein